ncbi:MAG TPA: amino acid permease [Baekduia sp.]|uniref:amino acid permease n=1 Tax=Baekduia sp. TaxID=2600305 RepID=UPI002BA58843|nr:amino acid permease [Baekduia sp.]HMJ32852.1 amino acid permease [Baekduia sp.]
MPAAAGGRRGSGNGGTTAAPRSGPFARKPAHQLVAETGDDGGLRKAVGAVSLTAMGLGAIIGTGIFVIIGEAIGLSGPAIVLSFALAAITCVFSALSYSELASTIPVSGSAYTYSYATLGELVAWIIGWDLILEYGVSVAAIAVGWGGYLQSLLDSLIGVHLPDAISKAPGDGGTFNLPAVVLVLAIAALLCVGVRESTRTNTAMVAFKLVVLILFVILGGYALLFHEGGGAGGFSPFATHGFSGVVDAAALIFFAYIGFDAVSTSGEEAEKPQRDLPVAIIGSLVIATFLYVVVALVTVGLAPASELGGSTAPLADALEIGGGYGSWAADVLSLGALVAITSVVLTILYGQTRIMFAMTRDGLLPRGYGKLSARRTPVRITVSFGVAIALLAAFIPLTEIAKLVNIGTLFAFVLVNIGVIVLRRTEPDMERGFRVPFVPWFPLAGIALCIYLMTRLEGITWLRFGVWLVLGLAIYGLYGRTHSRLQRGDREPLVEPGR